MRSPRHVLLSALGAQGGLDKAQHPVLDVLRGPGPRHPLPRGTCRSTPHLLLLSLHRSSPAQRAGPLSRPLSPTSQPSHRRRSPGRGPGVGSPCTVLVAGGGASSVGAALLDETAVLTQRQVPSVVVWPRDAHGMGPHRPLQVLLTEAFQTPSLASPTGCSARPVVSSTGCRRAEARRPTMPTSTCTALQASSASASQGGWVALWSCSGPPRGFS